MRTIPTIVLFFASLACFPSASSAQITLNCPQDKVFVECPQYSFSGPVCLNCHAIEFPTASTSCPQGGIQVAFTGSEVLSTPPPSGSFNFSPMDTVRTSGLSAFQTVGFGEIALFFRATDACGNTALCSYKIRVDPIGPMAGFVYCPSDTVVAAPPGAVGVVVEFPAPVFVSNCFNFGLTQPIGPPSGSLFPIGKTSVLFVGAQILGTDYCTFTVTVEAGTPADLDGDCISSLAQPASELLCASPNPDGGYDIVSAQQDQAQGHVLSPGGELLSTVPVQVDSSGGAFQLVWPTPGTTNATTELQKLNPDGSVAYSHIISGYVEHFYRSPCDADRFIFKSGNISGGGGGGTVIEKYKIELRLAPNAAVEEYRCYTYVQFPTMQGSYYFNSSRRRTDDGGSIECRENVVTQSNDPVGLPLGKTLRIFRRDASGNLLWGQNLNTDGLPDLGCVQVFERPDNQFVLLAALPGSENLWAYLGDCAATQSSGSTHTDAAPNFAIFPNPATEQLWLRVPEDYRAGDCQVALFDLRGSQVLSQHLAASALQPGASLEISLRALPPGMYLLRCATQHGQAFVGKVKRN
jgi:hypothetical protein